MSWHLSEKLKLDFENSRCSRAQEVESLVENSLAGEPFAPSSSMSTQGMCSSPGKTTDASNHSQSGTTCGHSMETRGEELLTWFREAFHARTSAPLEEAPELPGGEAGSGHTWHESLAKYDPVSRSWKTHQCLLDGGLEPFSKTWPRWGMMRAGECWALTMPEHLTNGTGSGFWPTPTTSMVTMGDVAQAQFAGSDPRRPKYQDAKMWPTPCARDYKDTGRNLNWESLSKKGKLAGAVMFPTPSANDNRDRGNLGTPAIQRRIAKGKQIMLSMSVSKESGALNPNWVEWLMGWPIGHTDCAASATARFQSWLRSHGIHS